MEIGVCYPPTPRWPKMAWVADACERLGYDTRRVQDREAFAEASRECDLLILGHKSLAGRWPNIKESLENRRCPAVYWWFDLVAIEPGVSIGDQALFEQFERHFRNCDLALVKERGLLHEYEECGIPVDYCDQGCPSDYPSVWEEDIEWDLLLWGQVGHYRQRVRDVEAVLEKGYRVAWAGDQTAPPGCVDLPWTHPEELPELASKARAVLSCGRRNDVDGYWSDSFWLATGMGACVLRRSTPGIPGGPYMVYRDEGELCDMLYWIQKNPEEARELGEDCREWVMTNHTIEHRVQEILKKVAGTAIGAGRP